MHQRLEYHSTKPHITRIRTLAGLWNQSACVYSHQQTSKDEQVNFIVRLSENLYNSRDVHLYNVRKHLLDQLFVDLFQAARVLGPLLLFLADFPGSQGDLLQTKCVSTRIMNLKLIGRGCFVE